MSKIDTSNFETSKIERFNYAFYFLGQGMTYVILYSFLQPYALDAGISALIFAGVSLAIKAGDAINDPIFGFLLEKIHLKGDKYLPWIKISILIIPLATFLVFAIPTSLPIGAKIAWLVIGYMLWDVAYAIGDVPIYVRPQHRDEKQHQRENTADLQRLFLRSHRNFPSDLPATAGTCQIRRMDQHHAGLRALLRRHHDPGLLQGQGESSKYRGGG